LNRPGAGITLDPQLHPPPASLCGGRAKSSEAAPLQKRDGIKRRKR
jgi:hypothetical protein